MIKMSQFTMSVLFLKEVLIGGGRTSARDDSQLNWIYAVAIFNDARLEEMERYPVFGRRPRAARRARTTR